MRTRLIQISLFVFAVGLSCLAAAEGTIKLGMSTALSGPAQEIGRQLKAGAELHFNHYNKTKNPEQIAVELITLDDGYEPSKTVINARTLIYQHQVDALFGVMGTPTSFAIKAILEHSKVPLLMPYTGADFLQQPKTFSVFNLRASYDLEAQEIIRYLMDEQRLKRIGFLIQADEFGLTVEQSLTKALKRRGQTPVVITRFRRNTGDIAQALSQAKQQGVDAIAMVGTYEPLAKFINQAQQDNFHPYFATVSFAASNELYARLNGAVDLLVTEVVPDPESCQATLCRQFRQQASQANLPVNEQTFEGFLNAQMLTLAVQACDSPIQTPCLLNALEQTLVTNKIIREVFMLAPEQKKLPVYRSFF